MKRFMGMMPSDEVEINKRIKDSYGHGITIQAGKNDGQFSTQIYRLSTVTLNQLLKRILTPQWKD
jgi:hypothetical protein